MLQLLIGMLSLWPTFEGVIFVKDVYLSTDHAGEDKTNINHYMPCPRNDIARGCESDC